MCAKGYTMEEMTIFESDVFTDADEARKEFYDELEERFEKPLDSISDQEIYDFLIWREQEEWDNETSSLCSYMPSDMQLISRGSIGRWDGTSHGFELSNGFDDLLHSDIFKDCERYHIRDAEGKLFVTGYHHDGQVNIEVKCISKKGEALLEDWYLSDQDYNLNKIWDDPELSYEPKYAENVLGVDWSLNKDKEAPAASLADRASVAKDVCVGMEQNVPERNIDMDAR